MYLHFIYLIGEIDILCFLQRLSFKPLREVHGFLFLFIVSTLAVIPAHTEEEGNSSHLQSSRDRMELNLSLVTYYSLDLETSTKSNSIEICHGDCSFVLQYGIDSILMTKNQFGQVIDSQIVHGGITIDNPSVPVIDVDQLGINFESDPLLMFGDRLFALLPFSTEKPSILEFDVISHTDETEGANFYRGQTNRHLFSYNGGVFDTAPEACGPALKRRTNYTCIEETSTNDEPMYFISWLECTVEHCEKDGKPYRKIYNCSMKSIKIAQAGIEFLFGIQMFTNCAVAG